MATRCENSDRIPLTGPLTIAAQNCSVYQVLCQLSAVDG